MTRSLICYGIISEATQQLVTYRYRKADADLEAERLGAGHIVKFAAYWIKNGFLVV